MAETTKTKKSLVIELAMQAAALTKKDIRDWRNAWQMALSIERPLRNPLYDIYNDVLADGHVTGAIEQRKKLVLQKSFKFVDPKTGKEIPEITQQFETRWFKDLMDLALDARFYGHSLIQLGDPVDVNGTMRFSDSVLVPRKHVIPELGIITREAGGEVKDGWFYREPPFSDWLVEVGKPDDLGLLLKCAPHSISKKNMAAFWDQFGEIFGMPMRIAKTSTREPKELARIDSMLDTMGAKAWARVDESTDVEFKENSKGDAYNVYDKRIERCNNELSKIIIGQTMTLDDGSSLSQSETHLDILLRLTDSDADMLRDVINDQVIPHAIMHGVLKTQARFDWDEPLNFTPAEQLQMEQMLVNKYDIEPEYFMEKYNVPILGLSAQQTTEKNNQTKDEKKKENLNYSPDDDFFV